MASGVLKPVEKQRVAEEIVEQLRALILTGEYPPGAKLPAERELAKKLGVNRASLREALKKLEHLGLVRIRQGDGTRVLNYMETAGVELVRHLLPLAGDMQPVIVRDVLEFRRFFGREVARLAAMRATAADRDRLVEIARQAAQPNLAAAQLFELDFEFYVAMTAATGNQVMGLMVNTVRDAVASYGPMLVQLTVSAEVMVAHHAALIEALAARDEQRAMQVAEEYLSQGASHVLGEVGGSDV